MSVKFILFLIFSDLPFLYWFSIWIICPLLKVWYCIPLQLLCFYLCLPLVLCMCLAPPWIPLSSSTLGLLPAYHFWCCSLYSVHTRETNIHININSACQAANHLDTCFAKQGSGHVSRSHTPSPAGTCRGHNSRQCDESLTAAFQAPKAGRMRGPVEGASLFAWSAKTEAKT